MRHANFIDMSDELPSGSLGPRSGNGGYLCLGLRSPRAHTPPRGGVSAQGGRAAVLRVALPPSVEGRLREGSGGVDRRSRDLQEVGADTICTHRYGSFAWTKLPLRSGALEGINTKREGDTCSGVRLPDDVEVGGKIYRCCSGTRLRRHVGEGSLI